MIFFLKWFAIVVVGYLFAWGYVVYGAAPFHYRYSRPVAWLLDRMGMAFLTIGAICFKDSRERIPTYEQGVHERHHYHQWKSRPFMAPIYLFWLVVRGYNRHDDENDARREAGQKER